MKFHLRYVGTDPALRLQGPWLIEDSGVTIGREGLIKLNSDKASSLHARVQLRHGQAVLEHMSQTNSTMVNGQAVESEQTLKVGDRIKIARDGGDEFTLEKS